MITIAAAALKALEASTTAEKVSITHQAFKAWFDGEYQLKFDKTAPQRPGRPSKPVLMLPKDMPKRRKAKARASRIAMLHAIAHIELNAIDLAWDIVLRFGEGMPKEFIDDWVRVANDEARHFELLNNRLENLDTFYGSLPAHDGLWKSAEDTAHDLLARLAVVPLVLEARGLDVTPGIIRKLQGAGDQQSVEILQTIYTEEIEHVRAGQKWFNYLCDKKNLTPEITYRNLVDKYFSGSLKPPFNIAARTEAGFTESFYMPFVGK